MSYGFGTTWGWVMKVFIFEWTIPLSRLYLTKSSHIALGKLGESTTPAEGGGPGGSILLPTAPTCLGGERQVHTRALWMGGVFVEGYFKTLAQLSLWSEVQFRSFSSCPPPQSHGKPDREKPVEKARSGLTCQPLNTPDLVAM